jgi:hypothetical protein
MDKRSAERQTALGLPAEPLLSRRLLFDAASRSLILVFHLTRDGIPFPKVYLRGDGAPKYSEITSFFSTEDLRGESITAETPVLSAGGRLYCLFNRRGQRSAVGHVPIFVVGIGMVDLVTRHTSLWPVPLDFSVTELVGGAGDGSRVYAVVGVTKSTHEGSLVDYGIGELDISGQTMRLVSSLPSPFF